MESDAKLLSRQIFPAQSTHIMERKNIYKQGLKEVFYSRLLPLGIGLFPFLTGTKSALLAGPLQAVLTTLDNTWLKGESIDCRKGRNGKVHQTHLI